MDFVDSNPVDPKGEAMAAELRIVHDIIRRDLVVVRELAESVKEGASSEAAQARVEALAVSSPIWTLQVSCLRYCRFVHGHHVHEDSAFFPHLTRTNPALTPTVERLQREHQTVARLLAGIERQTEALDHDANARQSLSGALDELATHLLDHLDWEEDALFPTLRRMTEWRG